MNESIERDSTHGPQVFGHPRGLMTLFFTEAFERFTYYGMRAILVLFMTAAIANGGLGLDDRTASAIYGLYISGTYLLSLLGGWIADRLIGQQRAVFWGGVMIMLGNGCLATGNTQLFFIGLMVIVLGVGLLKPNISAIVAQLYPEGGSRRDAGFSIFYMGINTGAFLGSLLVPIAAQELGWNAGFALPAIGMLLGLVQFQVTKHYLGTSGVVPMGQPASWTPVIGFVVVVVVLMAAALLGYMQPDPVVISEGLNWALVALAAGYFAYLLFFAGLETDERKRVVAMIALFIACAMFWAGFEQAGASFNLFADRHTDRNVFGWDMPAGVLQAVNPMFIILFAPVFAAIWVNLGRRNLDPSAPAKFAVGLILMGFGFLVMFMAARYVVAGEMVMPTWLILTYLLHTFGELCLSPVGLSSMTKLAPARFVGQVMGLWFLATALGNNLAGQFAGEIDPNNLPGMPGQFLYLFWWGFIAGVVLLVLTPFIRKMMAGVK
ncbi:peptide MFS transporter [Steroidobacter sp. S1-65]|uniref:Peptide MFS transporter n=1 Tax=Steroidobacter gossypii TaxID=2805490 RepID=A0ABS1WT50_9GAMM|nr:peptide MFS transporter [Steroidobacter gossypii]MBM0104136.1 peptide MFS transporter [Steroidobacter gossypii]